MSSRKNSSFLFGKDFVLVGITLLALLVAFATITNIPNSFTQNDQELSFATGNGAPNGAHYNLNIHGVPKGKTADMTGSSGHNIFVPEVGKCKINLSQGDFRVLDGNCTDGPAAFQLPNPDPTNSGISVYSVWARALGKPGGSSNTSTCADLVTTDPVTGETLTENYCSVYTLTLTRQKGKSTFGDVSRYLLYMYADLNADGVLERYPLFDPALQGYTWDYDNHGLKLVQLRFYPQASIVPSP